MHIRCHVQNGAFTQHIILRLPYCIFGQGQLSQLSLNRIKSVTCKINIECVFGIRVFKLLIKMLICFLKKIFKGLVQFFWFQKMIIHIFWKVGKKNTSFIMFIIFSNTIL